MSADLVVAVRFKADGSGLVGASNDAKAAVAGVGAAAAAAGGQARDFASATAGAERGTVELGAAATRTSAATRDLAGSEQQAGLAARTMAAEQRQASTATQALGNAQIAQNRVLDASVRSAGQVKAGYFSMGQQIQDIGVQLSSGTDLFRVLALQGGQLATAIDQIGPKGAAGAVSRFFMGPWGTAVFFAGSVLGPLIGKLFETENSLNDLITKKASDARQSQLQATANDIWGRSLDGVIDKTNKLTGELDRQLKTRQQLAQDKLAEAQGSLADSRGAYDQTLNSLVAADARLNRAVAVRDANTDPRLSGAYRAEADSAQRNLVKLEGDIGRAIVNLRRAEGAVRSAEVPIIEARVEASLDAATAATTRYTDALGELRVARQRDQISAVEFERRLATLGKQRQADEKAARDSSRTSRQGVFTDFLRPVEGGRVSGRFGEGRPGHNHGGIDYAVPVGTPVRASARGAVTFADGQGDYGNLVKINHGAGTETRDAHLSRILVRVGEIVERGQVIGFSGGARGAAGAGNSGRPHLHHEVRRGGRAVDPGTGRFATDDGAIADAAVRGENARERIDAANERAAEHLKEQADRAAESIARVNGQWGETPKLVEQARAETARLDTLIADLAEKKPPGFEQLIDDARAAQQVIRSGLERPFNDFVAAQQESHQIGQLILSGRLGEAEAQRTILQIEQQRGPLSDAQRDAVIAVTAAMRDQERQIERMRERQQLFLGALDDTRRIITDTIAEGAGSLEKLPGRVFASFKKFATERIFDDVFGDAFETMRRDIEEGGLFGGSSDSPAAALSDLFDQRADQLGGTVGEVVGELTEFGAAVGAITAAMRANAGAGVSAAGFGATRDAQARATTDVLVEAGRFGGVLDDRIRGTATMPGEVVVNGQRRPSTSDFYGKQITESLKSIGISDDAASKIGKFSGKGLAGAFQGQTAASVAGLFGIKTSGTGAAIGGALGGLTGLPGAGFVGGLLGGVVGKLFAGAPKSGSATIGDTTTDASTGGNSGALKKVASGLAGTVQGALSQIAEQLGGEVGSFGNITIGKRGDDFRVNASGTSLKTKKGAQDFGDDEGAAIAAAVRIALERGAVQGLSSAVARALQSSPDIEKALSEATKVSELERSLGGIGGQLTQIFRDYDREAAERVALARKYGLDVLAVEKMTGEKRAELLEETLRDRVGSLRDLLKNIQYGDLFEGAASERRDLLMGEIAAAKTDADAGIEGANDRVAELYRQLITTSRDAFGTAGPEYSNDRDAAIEGVQRVIRIEEDRVNAAAAQMKAQTDAIVEGTALAGDQLAVLQSINNRLAAMGSSSAVGAGSFGPDYALVSRGWQNPATLLR